MRFPISAAGGTLPAGMNLLPTGTLTGVPTKAGVVTFTITATDANGCTGSTEYTIKIDCFVITLAPAALPSGRAGVLYNQLITAAGEQFRIISLCQQARYHQG